MVYDCDFLWLVVTTALLVLLSFILLVVALLFVHVYRMDTISVGNSIFKVHYIYKIKAALLFLLDINSRRLFVHVGQIGQLDVVASEKIQ
jgi:hypothetical protein